MAENGWSTWGEPRTPRKQLRVDGSQQARYCPRCDTQTVWAMDGNDNHPGLLACSCGMTLATELDLNEIANTRRQYRLTVGEVDDMVGLPAGART